MNTFNGIRSKKKNLNIYYLLPKQKGELKNLTLQN